MSPRASSIKGRGTWRLLLHREDELRESGENTLATTSAKRRRSLILRVRGEYKEERTTRVRNVLKEEPLS